MPVAHYIQLVELPMYSKRGIVACIRNHTVQLLSHREADKQPGLDGCGTRKCASAQSVLAYEGINVKGVDLKAVAVLCVNHWCDLTPTKGCQPVCHSFHLVMSSCCHMPYKVTEHVLHFIHDNMKTCMYRIKVRYITQIYAMMIFI